MKKLLKKVIISLIILTICAVSLVGCKFVGTNPPDKTETWGEGETLSYTTNVNLPNSLNLANEKVDVEFSTVFEDRQEDPMSLASVAQQVRRSVVTIYVNNGSASSTGSGVIVDINLNGEEDENIFYIITCHHVIESLGNVSVYIPDENCRNPLDSDYNSADYTFTGTIGNQIYPDQAVTLVGGDKASDIAVLKLDISGSNVTKNDIVEAKFMDVTKHTLNYGEEVFAIGNPGGEAPGSLSHGVITYLFRETEVEDIGTMVLNQIDVQTNPGNSGGPLFNMYGELVGITNAGDTSIEGVNFAIPLTIPTSTGEIDNGVINIATQLIASATETNYGYVSGRRVTWGVTFLSETVSGETVVSVMSTIEGSLAQQAGFRVNDKILKLKVNDQPYVNVIGMQTITDAVNSMSIGDVITFMVERALFNTGVPVEIQLTSYQYHFCNTGN